MADPTPPRRRRRVPLFWRVPAALRLLNDPAAKLWEKLLLVGAVIYVVWPFDLIPDLAPILGMADDFGVVAIAAVTLQKSLERYADGMPTVLPPKEPGAPAKKDIVLPPRKK